MAEPITEWEFTADVASWVNLILARDSSLPFSQAKCEQRGSGSNKRRDLTLLDKNQVIVLTGEVKLPYRKDGGSPYNAAVVKDARAKAQRAGAAFFFTWNVNEFVLWETEPSASGWQGQNYRAWKVTSVHRDTHMAQPMTIAAIQGWLALLLNDFAKVLRGTVPIGHRLPDEIFIEMLESALRLPILLNLDELGAVYKLPRGKADLDRWMRDDQGWIIYDDPEGVRDNLERASKFACYALVNKLVFYEALLKRHGAKLDQINIPKHLDTGEALRHHLEGYFAEAKKVTGDYETVFGEDHKSVGNRISFYSDAAVPHWRELINQIHEFDFSKLDYEVIGSIFERLIGPEERHKYGQFYTRVEVVDLINSFCIRDGTEKVMDPACGGGTFLVRAYARKRELAPARKHGELLSDLCGIDISPFAAHLTTINLATRDLIDDENYPLVARSDFFDVEAAKPFLSLPRHVKAKGLGAIQHRDVEVPLLDAVVGNPPYVRQEGIAKAKKKPKEGGPERGTKDYYRQLVQREAGVELGGRSDLHCYFWPHAANFLKPGGWLCLLTSSQWLDVEYGFRLQAWLLSNFEIVAVFESLDEPWFVGARVATTVTILRKQGDPKARMRNTARFVQLRRPMREILAHDGTTAGAVQAADAFRDEILALEANAGNERYRARLVKQGDLWRDGVALGAIMGKSGAGDDEEEGEGAVLQGGSYYGGKWGVYLRAPDLWFDLLDRYGERFVPLGDLAEIRFGVKSGADAFFFPRDCSEDCLTQHVDARAFEDAFGVPRKEVASGRVKLVRCGEGRGEIRPIEAKYLEPEVHSLMEVDGFTVAPNDCARMILLVGEPKDRLDGTYVLDYIEWGEKQGIHKGATCSARVTETREWYDLTGHRRGSVFWPKIQKYKHAIPLNEHDLQSNCSLYDLHLPDELDAVLLAGILNSSLVVLSKFQFGRYAGTEGTLKTEVVDVNMMLVPDSRKAGKGAKERVRTAFLALKKRKALQFLSEKRLRQAAFTNAGKSNELELLSDQSELEMPDRHELDDAVLELLGAGSRKERQILRVSLYASLREIFEHNRQLDEKTGNNKKQSKRRTAASPADIATQIFQDIVDSEPRWLRHYDPDFLNRAKPFDTYDLPEEGVPELHEDMFAAGGSVRFMKGGKKQAGIVETRNAAQAELVALLGDCGVRGLTRVPLDEAECRRLTGEFGNFVASRTQRLRELIEDRTADPEMQEKVFAVLVPRVLRGL